jgi:uracil-DNA glycosylase family 4
MKFSGHCRSCSRLSNFLDEVSKTYPDYHARPVPPFGDPCPELLIVGLAPGLHGANRTGRPFTGDYAGILLYETLYKYGYSNQPVSEKGDELALKGCRITNAVKCLPPQNKPEPSEIRQCNAYLSSEFEGLKEGASILALGTIAHNAVLSALKLKPKNHPFGHGNVHDLGRHMLHDSYHCSRYNTQTKRLTKQMFEEVFERISRKGS